MWEDYGRLVKELFESIGINIKFYIEIEFVLISDSEKFYNLWVSR